MTEENQWGENADPLEDMRKAMAKIKEPTPKSFYRSMYERELLAQEAIKLLIKEGKTPEEIEQEFVKYGIWRFFD